jgi:hypothetical protein
MSHSLLAPSAAAMWSRCVGALYMGKGRAKPATIDSASGTCTHSLGECLLKDGRLQVQVGDVVEVDGFKFTIDEDRIDRAKAYANNVLREPASHRFVEHRLDTSAILGIEGQEGHADCVALDPDSSVAIDGVELKGIVSVHDFKDGNNIVYAKNNLQGLIYVASALYEFDLLADYRVARFCIHQPRQNHYDEWSYTRTEIEHFISIIRPAAKLAYDLYHGNVDFDPNLHLNAGDEQCKWCPVRGSCPARAKRIVDMFAKVLVKHEIDDNTLSEIYIRLDEVESACRDFRGEALHRALQGRRISGQKLVRGRKGKRSWVDSAKAQTALEMLLDDEKMYEPREIISPTAADKILKSKYKLVKQYVTQADGGITLAPEIDPRDEITPLQFEVLPS